LSSIQPHDRFVRHAFSYPDLARDFFRLFLGDLQNGIDLDTLQPEPDTDVSSTLGKTMTDVLYSAAFREHLAYLYLLLEHKSEGAERGQGPSLPWQMLLQKVALMERHRRADAQGKLPLIVCIGLFHGENPYPGPRTIADQIDAPDEMIPDMWREEILLVFLSITSDEELHDKGKLTVFLLMLKHIYEERLAEVYRDVVPLMLEIERNT